MTLLGEADITERLAALDGWNVEDAALVKAFEFSDYMAGIRFVDRLAEVAEEQEHHPDLEIGYGRVVVRVSTHSEGGITGRDFRLASSADAI